MKEICSKCSGKFIESPKETKKRSNNDTYAICPKCRVSNALSNRPNALSKKKEKVLPIEKQLKILKRKHGLLSTAFLMRKFKVTLEEAKKMMLE